MADLIYEEKHCCAKAIEILSRGDSLAALSAELHVTRDTIYDWRDKHPAFAKALSIGLDKSQAYWEEIGKGGVKGEIKNFGGAPWIFTMKNRFRRDYAEVKEEKSVSDSLIEKLIEKLID